jgi:adenylylsulfate kinase-like enzyme
MWRCKRPLTASKGLGRDTSTAELEYQTPLSPDLIIDANDLNIQKMVDVIICLLNEKGIL